jgi:hypothetical protein
VEIRVLADGWRLLGMWSIGLKCPMQGESGSLANPDGRWSLEWGRGLGGGEVSVLPAGYRRAVRAAAFA